jgi:hypothetical protein
MRSRNNHHDHYYQDNDYVLAVEMKKCCSCTLGIFLCLFSYSQPGQNPHAGVPSRRTLHLLIYMMRCLCIYRTPPPWTRFRETTIGYRCKVIGFWGKLKGQEMGFFWVNITATLSFFRYETHLNERKRKIRRVGMNAWI